jgi:dipeptidyl aminopeptidase/acylaminoacyl peptidase
MLRFIILSLSSALATAQIPDNLTVEGVPPISDELRRDASRYMEARRASFLGWHPTRREMLISTRFAETAQLHAVKMPGGARTQLTFGVEPAGGGSWQPGEGKCIVFSQDTGGGEFYQLYRLDADGRITVLTDGKSRNGGANWAGSGKRFAFTSTRRNGKDNDIYVQDPFDPASAKLVLEVSGGGWSVLDWSRDEARLLIGEYISANESRLHTLELASGKAVRITPEDAEKVAWEGGQFLPDGTVLSATDRGGEFRQLVRLDPKTKSVTPLLREAAKWDVEAFDLSPDGKTVAYLLNEEGASRLKLAATAKGGINGEAKILRPGIISGIEWNAKGDEIGFTFSSASGPADAQSLALSRDGNRAIFAWTHSETGGLDFSDALPAELLRIESFDGTKMSGFLYRPDAKKFPGPRPCVINIHGGPEGQSRPDFLARWSYLVRELGIAVFYPNVRGSDGFGKTFLAMDNGFKREDSVKDIGAFIFALKKDAALDGTRLAVMGGSYGGYMVLASMIHHGAELRCGVDVVGISNFLTFLKNTQDYRRDLRRVEYGDERDAAMAEHLARISPTARAGEIKKPLFIIQGKNDPRVPVTEAQQMRDAVRKAGGIAWYLEAADEGHGFAKKKNADFLFLSVVQFFKEHLLK